MISVLGRQSEFYKTAKPEFNYSLDKNVVTTLSGLTHHFEYIKAYI